MHRLFAAIERVAPQIEAQAAEMQLFDNGGSGGGRRDALQDVADAQHQLARLEGLGQIIVGAALQPVDAVLGLGHRGQQQDRHVAGLAQALGQREAALARHHHIDDQQIESDARQLLPRLGGIARRGDAKAGFDEIAAQQVAQPRIIVDDQKMGFGGIAVHGAIIHREEAGMRLGAVGLSAAAAPEPAAVEIARDDSQHDFAETFDRLRPGFA